MYVPDTLKAPHLNRTRSLLKWTAQQDPRPHYAAPLPIRHFNVRFSALVAAVKEPITDLAGDDDINVEDIALWGVTALMQPVAAVLVPATGFEMLDEIPQAPVCLDDELTHGNDHADRCFLDWFHLKVLIIMGTVSSIVFKFYQ